MGKILDLFDRFTGRVDSGVQVIVSLTLGLISILMITQVLFRYIVRSPIIWVEEAAGFLLGYVALWGASSCLRQGRHISVEFIRRMFPNVIQLVVRLLGFSIIGYLSAIMIRDGYAYTIRVAGQLSPSGSFDPSHARMAIPTAGILLLLQAVNCSAKGIRGFLSENRQVPADGSKDTSFEDL